MAKIMIKLFLPQCIPPDDDWYVCMSWVGYPEQWPRDKVGLRHQPLW